MAIDILSSDELCAAIAELDRCLYNHEQWLEALFGTIICGLPPDQSDLDGESHRKCRLGQWYYSGTGAAAALAERPGFPELGIQHERVHIYAAKMLRDTEAGEEISFQEYQRFMNALKSMRLELLTLRQDMENILHALDAMTGVPGAAGLLTKLREQQALLERGVQSCCLAIMDLDRLKTINDKFGDAAGDKVLTSFTHHMTQSLRPYDKVFRYGGEEFVIVMPATDPEQGLAIIERLREGLALVPQALGPKEPVYVTASFGIVLLEPSVSVEMSIKRAHKALYAAKAAGRNRSVVWDPSMDVNPASSLHTAA